MAPRKRKKKQIDEGPFLFSEEEMSGMITNIAIIETPDADKVNVPLSVNIETHNDIVTEADTDHETKSVVVSVQSVEELTTDERIVVAMTDVLWQMKHMDKSQVRRIAFSIAVMCQQGLDLNRNYIVPVIQDDEMSGYKLAAWCYCTFVSAFPSMLDKLQLPYAEHYAKAKANIGMD